MGRKPVPPVLRLLTGNPGKRGVAKDIRDAVKATLAAGKTIESTIGPAPEHLSPMAAEIWNRIADEAVWLDAANRDLLEAYCLSVESMRLKPTKFRSAAMLVRSLGAELGLSATSRARLSTGPGKRKSASDLPAELTDAATKPAGA